MRSRTIKFSKTFGLICILLVTMAVLGGCKKKSEPAHQHEHEHTAAVSTTEGTPAVTETEQTMCPVMDKMKIDKNVFVEYKGKKVYFCCEDCKKAFEADPEKYIDKLPQFGN